MDLYLIAAPPRPFGRRTKRYKSTVSCKSVSYSYMPVEAAILKKKQPGTMKFLKSLQIQDNLSKLKEETQS